jgi:hypothetical protein
MTPTIDVVFKRKLLVDAGTHNAHKPPKGTSPKTPSSASFKVHPKRDPNSMVYGGNSHPTRCGYRDKLYSRYDYVGPTLDSMTRLHCRSHASVLGKLLPNLVKVTSKSYSNSFVSTDAGDTWGGEGGFGMQRPPKPHTHLLDTWDVTTGVASATAQTSQPSKPSKPSKPLPPILCEGCHTRDPSKIQKDERNGEWVCVCGVVGARCAMGADYKETHDTDSSKARADAPYTDKRKERFGSVPIGNREESKRIRESLGIGASAVNQGSVVPATVRSKLKLGYAPEKSNKAADMEPEEMDKKHVSKLISVLKEINALVVHMAPVDPGVARVIRITTNRIYRDAFKHSQICKNSHCQLALVFKPARVIAHKSFVYTVEQLCNGNKQADGVSKTQLALLHERVSDSQIFRLRDNATQHEACLAMIHSIDTGDVCVQCNVVEGCDAEDKTLPSGMILGSGDTLRRQVSDVQPSHVMVVREAVFKLSEQFKFPTAVRDAAVTALGNRDFAQVIKNGTVVPHTASKFGKAYILLRSVQDETGAKTCCVGSSNISFDHSAHVQRVNMSNYDVDGLILQMRGLLPMKTDGVPSSVHGVYEDDNESFY